jgi:hypothetical protein
VCERNDSRNGYQVSGALASTVPGALDMMTTPPYRRRKKPDPYRAARARRARRRAKRSPSGWTPENTTAAINAAAMVLCALLTALSLFAHR